MDRAHDIEVELHFVATEKGGRKGAAFSGYSPQFFYDGQDWVAVHEYPDVSQVNPGDTVRAYMTFLDPQEHVGKLSPGMRFQCREGNRVIAEGRILRLLELEESARRVSSGERPRCHE